MAFNNMIVRVNDKGEPVSELQTLLNNNGYNLDVDGVFGKKTQAAVKDYQTNNGLDVDGIVGEQTWGALTGSSTGKTNTSTTKSTNTSTTKPANTGFTYNEFTYDDYKASDTVKQAYDAINAQLGAKPGELKFTWQEQLNSIVDQIFNREDFSYDLNSDALYQQYKDQYTQLGKMAMQDTMGQAAAMTGGYGNSYAATAGNQAYQAYLSELNNVVPELYQMALDKYYRDGEELYNNYSLLSDQYDKEYTAHQDAYNNWFNELQRLENSYYNELNFDYGTYLEDRNLAYNVNSDKNAYAYNEYRNAIDDEHWEKEFGLNEEQWKWQKKQYNDSKADSPSGSTAIPITPEQEEAYKKYVGGGSTAGNTGNTAKSNITSAIESKAESFESNDALASWAYGLADAGTITEDEADVLITTYMDQNEKYVDREDGSKTISYKDMVKSTNGWSVVNNGGTNWFWGVDNNAIVKAPNGEQIRLDNLVDYLVDEGMSKSDAKSYVKKLQKNLGI